MAVLLTAGEILTAQARLQPDRRLYAGRIRAEFATDTGRGGDPAPYFIAPVLAG